MENKNKKVNKKKRLYRLEVGVACIYKDGKYLIQSRPEGKSFVGHWEFPGGKREKNEDYPTCIKREIKEELDVEVKVGPVFFEEHHNFGKINLILHFRQCEIIKGEPRPLEGQNIDWVAPQDFHKVKFLETNAKALEKLQSMSS
ncbi:(deoxy)nucleoside triphosphate pyrophosphohydrolase [Candidatus Gracilibacteria bacterium]|nr:(deoxy)nucleoside triphosphate pyrophosphohydrolase [Candidatus Gracilibacteria bacterium]